MDHTKALKKTVQLIKAQLPLEEPMPIPAPYRAILRLSFISNPEIYLKDYLQLPESAKGRVLADRYQYAFIAFLEDNYPDLITEEMKEAADAAELYSDDPRIESMPDTVFEDFYQDGIQKGLGYEDADAPSFLYMQFEGIVKNQWLIHFTSDAMQVANQGFTQGTPDLDQLGLTTYLSESYKSGGYNFAYLLDDYARYGKRHMYNEWKYGNEAVIFRASGIKVYHVGDQEPQVIFNGASATDIIPIRKVQDGQYAAGTDWDEHMPTFDDLDGAVEWAIQNFAQYRSKLVW
jgi:hypothetical protein